MPSRTSDVEPPGRAGSAMHRAAEEIVLPTLLLLADSGSQQSSIEATALRLIQSVREQRDRSLFTELLRAWPAHSVEGQALMGLAECCLRVPDAFTRRLLIRDKLTQGQWQLGSGYSAQVNFMAWCLRLCRRRLAMPTHRSRATNALFESTTESMIEQGTMLAMRQLGKQFVFGEAIDDALQRARRAQLSCSFDMLGEAARCQRDAQHYCAAYERAILAVGKELADGRCAPNQHAISVKLSALHPRYEAQQATRVVPALVAQLTALAQQAMTHGIALCIDAEESDRLEMSLDIVAQLLAVPALRDWSGLGLAVQAYQKRALPVIEWLESLAAAHHRRITVRLVKGAYWDMEVKRCQERGLVDFPVFTRKAATDVSYLACARQLLRSPHLRPAFATHNAQSIATLLHWIPRDADVEFQRLHGMASALYTEVGRGSGIPCRVYAPVGAHHELLPYLIRRMLENSSNSGFIQQLGNSAVPITELAMQPAQCLEIANAASAVSNPAELFGTRRNSKGMDLAARAVLDELTGYLASGNNP